MITDVVIEEYQAVRKAQLRLGRFTVITGPTGSGKSAVIRAIKLVVFNARGTSYIRHGAKTCAALVGFEHEERAVAIHRGGRGADKYRITTRGDDLAPAHVEYTKLAGSVPEQVSAVLRLGRLNFAGQFDRPYLLDSTGSEVARTLGELTNVTLVLDAAREATRRKQETGRDLKRAEQELADLSVQAQQFRGLRERRLAVTEAGDRLHSARLVSDSIDRLRKLEAAHARAVAEHAEAARQLEAAKVPSLDGVEELRGSLARLRSLSNGLMSLGSELVTWKQAEQTAEAAERQLHQELHDLLREAGVCPTCGQTVSGLWKTRSTSTGRMS